MKKNNILLVEDELSIRAMITFALHPEFNIIEANNVAEARIQIAEQMPDLILLDWMLPDKSGIDFIKEIKKNKLICDIPIIMLTAKAEESNKIKGLMTGADDYITKPFSPRELIVRIKTVLRRGPLVTPENIINVGDISVNVKTNEVMVSNKMLKLTNLEYQLLHFFVTHQNRLYSREQLINYIWGGASDVDERTVDALIKRLRRKLVPYHYDGLILTVRSMGYKFSSEFL